jgi:hypothetical protein
MIEARFTAYVLEIITEPHNEGKTGRLIFGRI